MTWVFTIITVIFLAVLLVGERSNETLRNVAKPVASAGFLGVAISAGAIDTSYGTWVLVGLLLGAAGDVFLLGVSRGAFLGGLAAFLLGHVAYVVAFAILGVASTPAVVTAIVVGAIAVVVLMWLRPHVPDGLIGPVIAYIAVISTMLVVAYGAGAAGATELIPIAATAFFVSDLFVARDRFVTPGFANRVWGLPLYYGAQLLLAWSVLTVT